MRTPLLAAILLCTALSAQDKHYDPTWESIDSRPTPAWFSDAKFGIFIHWGLYAVPSFAPPHKKNQTPYAEWYWHSLTEGQKAQKPDSDGYDTSQFHQRVYGAQFPYADFAPMFRAELFNPDQWAEILARSGAKYIVPTSKHHEGYALWPSADSSRVWGRPWNAAEIGPKRDLLGDLTAAVRKRGLKMGFYYSLYEWYNPLWLSDKKRYVAEYMFPQFKDVVTRYQPAIIFSDGEWEMDSADWRSPELLAWLFNESPSRNEVVINDRWGKDTRHKHGGYYTTEYTAGMQSGAHPWEESRGMGFSYGYNRVETAADYRTERELILMLVDIVSRGGNLLLDIGPTADGRIPVIMQERLNQMGAWLSTNGAAIYGTKPWKTARQWGAGKVPTFEEKEFMGEYDLKKLVDSPASGNARIEAFFTTKGDDLYIILPRWPRGDFTVGNVRPHGPVEATLLENGEKLETRTSGGLLTLRFPAFHMKSHEAWVVKLTGGAK